VISLASVPLTSDVALGAHNHSFLPIPN
jgi:hypothetical protein